MHKFAHIADIHLGAHREPVLQRLEADAFSRAMDKCIESDIDFILVCGDFFHVGIPDLGIVNQALLKIRQVQKAGVPIYVIYGSHDYTPNGTSVIDILDTAGIITKIVNMKTIDGKTRLKFFEDPKTGAKLTGISARKIGLERKYYEILDKESLENEYGFKIFAFHSAITEFNPGYLSEMESIPLSYFPKNFAYYAGGHIHHRGEFSFSAYEKVVFPGPIFTGYGKDLEATAKGEKRGFYIVNFDDRVRNIEFVEIKNFDGVYVEYDVTGKNSVLAAKELREQLHGFEVAKRIVVLKALGVLSGGKTSDINFTEIKSSLIERGALHVHLNRHALASREYAASIVRGEDISAIESKLFSERKTSVATSQEKFREGSAIAIELLRVFRQEAKINESKRDYADRMIKSGVETLRLKNLQEAAEI